MTDAYALSSILGGGSNSDDLRSEVEDTALAYDPAPQLGAGANLLADGSFEEGGVWGKGAGWTVPYKGADPVDGAAVARLVANGGAGHLISRPVAVDPLNEHYWVSFHHRLRSRSKGALRAIVRCLNVNGAKITDIPIAHLTDVAADLATATGDSPDVLLDEQFYLYGYPTDPLDGLVAAGWVFRDQSTVQQGPADAGFPSGTWRDGWQRGIDNTHAGLWTDRLSNGLPPGTVSRWLITPVLTLRNGATLKFDMWTGSRAAIQVRASAGAGSDTGAGATSVGTFTDLLYALHPSDVLTPGYQTYEITLSGITEPGPGRLAFRYYIPSSVSLDDEFASYIAFRDTFSRSTTSPAVGTSDTGQGYGVFRSGTPTVRADGAKLHYAGSDLQAANIFPALNDPGPWMQNGEARLTGTFAMTPGPGSFYGTLPIQLGGAQVLFLLHDAAGSVVEVFLTTGGVYVTSVTPGAVYAFEFKVRPGHSARFRFWPVGASVPDWQLVADYGRHETGALAYEPQSFVSIDTDDLQVEAIPPGAYAIRLSNVNYALTGGLPWGRASQHFGPIQETELEIPLPINTTAIRLLFAPTDGAVLVAELDGAQVLRGNLDAPFKTAPADGIDGTQIIAGTLPLTAIDTTAPEAPGQTTLASQTNIAADGSQTPYIDISWEPSPSDDVVAYEVQIDRAATPTFTFAQPTTTQTSATAHHTEEVRGGLYYGVRVAAIDRAGNMSDWSATTHIVGGGGENKALPIPTGLIVYAGIRLLRADWDDVTDSQLAFYQIRWRESDVGGGVPGSFTKMRITASFAILAGLIGTSDQSFFYDVQVRSVDRNGYTRASATDPQAVPIHGNPEAGWCSIVAQAPRLVTTADLSNASIDDSHIISVSGSKVTGPIIIGGSPPTNVTSITVKDSTNAELAVIDNNGLFIDMSEAFGEQSSDPATPASGKVVVYAKSDHRMYQKDSTGAVAALGASGSSMPTIVALGDIIVGFAPDIAGVLPVGIDGYTLYADSTQTLGIKWAAASSGGIPATIVDVKGDLIVATANDTVARLPAGTNGYMLYADSTQTTGLKWDVAPSGTGISPTIVDVKGDLIVASAADTVARFPVGADGYVLTADSAQTLGLSWAIAATGLVWTQDVTETGATFTNWSTLAGTWSSDGTNIKQTDATSAQRIALYTAINPMLNAIRVIEAEVRGITAGWFAALYLFDGANGNNGWQFGLDDSSDKFLADIPGGSAPAVLSVSHTNVTNVFYKIRAVLIGDMAHCYVDGTFMGTAHFTGGFGNMSRLGLIAWAACDFRNIKSWTLGLNLPA